MKEWMKHSRLLTLLVLGSCLTPVACSLRRTRLEPLPAEAGLALGEARELARLRPEGWRAQATEAARRAEAAAPDWLAPRRVLDDLEREELLGPQALAAHTARLAAGARADELYLAGRLEGSEGLARIELSARMDPNLAWAQHGLAWHQFSAGHPRAALRAGGRAVELARGSYELSVFALASARYRTELGEAEEALASLRETLDDERLAEPERTEIEVALARAELESENREEVEQGFARTVALLRSGRLTAAEYESLGANVLARRALAGEPDPLSVLLAALEIPAAAGGENEGRERLRARLLVERGAHALAGAAWERSGVRVAPGAFQRARDLERGDAERALERWRAALPARLEDEAGVPREPRLRELVLASRGVDSAAAAERFGDALLAVGWFAEAESFATGMLRFEGLDPDVALALSARATAGLALLGELRGVLEHIDEDRLLPARLQDGVVGKQRRVTDLDGLLESLQPLFERYRGAPLEVDLVRSPRLSFAGLAAVVHPGPRFSAQDEHEGRGERDSVVPGLAAELAHIGRFGIFGQAPGGGGPDGTVLRLVGSEWKEGEHLGVPFAGLVAWGEGVDIESRPGRQGSGVSGAALHEGYWVDIESVRREWERLKALEARFLAGDPAALERALAGRGPELPRGAGRDECARWMAPLGEGERVLLAALRERPAPAGEAGRVALDELLDLTALHEEGHLTDRTRFLPLSKHWPRALALLFRHGFSPRAVARALEYRAELVALCEAPEPRLALADCLASADQEVGVLTHGEAYRELVEDLLGIVRTELASLPVLDAEHYLLFQLHFLSGEDVRRLARLLAQRQGMLEE